MAGLQMRPASPVPGSVRVRDKLLPSVHREKDIQNQHSQAAELPFHTVCDYNYTRTWGTRTVEDVSVYF